MTAAAELDRSADEVARYPEQGHGLSGRLLRQAVDRRLKVDTGGDRRLSGIGNARLSTRSTVTGTVFVEARVAAGPRRLVGPWRWLNDGVRPWTTSAGNVHPGTPAKRTFDDPVDRTLPTVEHELALTFDRLPLLR